MADKADTIGVPGYEDTPAGNYPPFKGPDEAGLRATPTLADLQALDSRGVSKGTFQNQIAPTAKDVGWAKFFLWEGGTEWDAFFTAASAQVGQVILSLPHSLSQTRMVAGIIIEIVFASLAMWTVYLMVLLYLDHKNRKIKLGDWYDKEGKDRKVATQYHEVMGNITYKWLGRFSRLVIIIALGGDALAQIIASSSNFHTFIPSVNKREVMDSMYRPYNFHKTFLGSYSYVFTLVIPNTIFVYWGFPAEARQYGNCFAYFEPSVARDIAIILMVIHQIVAYGLFIFPLYYMWEKATNTHDKPMWIKVIVRAPIGAIIWFIAVAFPFFGVINEILGAFTVTFETFIIFCLAFNIHYGYKRFSATHQMDLPKPLTPFLQKIGGYQTVFWINWVIIAFTAVFGLGMGSYASIRGFIGSIGSFGVFAACYNC